tara:strand:- start:74 stop:376 length:303 start_codon:yes stop_codon:yes gene_type:complete
MRKIANKYRTIEGQDSVGNIRILEEKYNGIAVSIGKISIDASEDDKETATLQYDYDVLELPDGIEIDDEFNQLLGDIIVDILETKLKDDPDSLRFSASED